MTTNVFTHENIFAKNLNYVIVFIIVFFKEIKHIRFVLTQLQFDANITN